MRKERTHYDRAFKENAVKLSFKRTNITEFARELGVDPLLIPGGVKNTVKKVRKAFPTTVSNHKLPMPKSCGT